MPKLNDMENDSYQPFSDEWFAYWMKLPKAFILDRHKEWFGSKPDPRLSKKTLLILLAQAMQANPL